MPSEPLPAPSRPDRTRLLVSLAALALGLLLTLPSYLRVIRIEGGSDAPNLLHRDRVLVNRAAFDLRAPYSRIRLSELSDPSAGELVVLRVPGADRTVTGRIVAGPGEMVRVEGGRVLIDGHALAYEELPPREFAWVPAENRPGSVFARESGHGADRIVTYTPGKGEGFGPERVPAGHYFVLGDNRDRSEDSRSFGFVSRDRILGKVIRRFPGTGRR